MQRPLWKPLANVELLEGLLQMFVTAQFQNLLTTLVCFKAPITLWHYILEYAVALHQYFWHCFVSLGSMPFTARIKRLLRANVILKKCHVYADQQNAMAIGHQVTVVSKKKKKKFTFGRKAWCSTNTVTLELPIHNVYLKFVYCHAQARYTLAMPESEWLSHWCCQVHTQNTGMTVLTPVGQLLAMN